LLAGLESQSGLQSQSESQSALELAWLPLRGCSGMMWFVWMTFAAAWIGEWAQASESGSVLGRAPKETYIG
jgi:hypothetical protein